MAENAHSTPAPEVRPPTDAEIAERKARRSNAFGDLETPIGELRWQSVVVASFFDENMKPAGVGPEAFTKFEMSDENWQAMQYILHEQCHMIKKLYDLYYERSEMVQ